MIADFLLHLFTDLKRRPSTIAGYRSAIAGALRSSQGLDYGKNQELSSLILSFTREQPRSTRSIPAWDLGLVLRCLTRPPFEPLRDATVKLLTLKTAFLVLLATGSRRSEVHALDYSKVRHGPNWEYVILEPHMDFIAKTELRTAGASQPSSKKIPPLGPTLGPGLEEDLKLCPVRALKIYLARTQQLREDKKLLFIAYKKGHQADIHKNTLSSWIRKLLQLVYDSPEEDVLKLSKTSTHEVRALASSLAFRGTMELEEVLRSCTWRNATTFTSHYLRDVSTCSDDLFSLGPVVAAQKVVQPSSSSDTGF